VRAVQGRVPVSMEAAAPPLEDLRAEVDRIDQEILDRLIERTAVVRRIGQIKNDGRNGRLASRPGREAVILRRLVTLADGRFPTPVVVRMWRELIGAQTRLQTPLSVAVFVPGTALRIWDLARDQFGSVTPMTRAESASHALRSVSDGSAAVAVLPLPGDDDPWWLALIAEQHDRLRVFARLPFVPSGPGDGEQSSALALGRIEPEPSGDDLALLAIEAEGGVSRARLRELLGKVGLEAVWLAVNRPSSLPHALHLVEVSDFVAEGDRRLSQVQSAARAEVLRIVPVGGYPRPLAPG
jgi:chorismate mutase / prephenate dehydratase